MSKKGDPPVAFEKTVIAATRSIVAKHNDRCIAALPGEGTYFETKVGDLTGFTYYPNNQ